MAKPGRLFFQLDVNWYDEWGHDVSDDAALLWVVAVCGCKRMMKDGRLLLSQMRRVAPESLAMEPDRFNAAVDELAGHNDAPVDRDGAAAIVFRGWAAWNDLASDIEAMSEGGKYGNHVKWHVKKNKPSSECEFCNVSPPDIAPESGPESKSRVDTDTETDTDTELLERANKTRKTSAPQEFPIDDGLRQWASDHGLAALNLEAQTELFLNHHAAKGSLMADWRRAWFTWMGRAPQFQATGRVAPSRLPVSDRNRDRIKAAADEVRATESAGGR